MLYTKKHHQSLYHLLHELWLMHSRCYYFLIHRVVTYAPLSKSVVSQAHTSSWSQGFLWCFFLCSLPSTAHFNFISLPLYPHICPSILMRFLYFDCWYLIHTQDHSGATFSYPLFLHCQLSSLLAWSTLFGHSCIWLWKGEFRGWTLLLAIARRLVLLV